jgi:hypothetical protein
MAEFYVYNSLNPNKVVRFNITFRYFVIKGTKGEYMWTLEIGTTHTDINGDPISPARAHKISAKNVDEIIENALAGLCAQVDWSPLMEDRYAPYINYVIPLNGETDVSLGEDIEISIKDRLPSAGIDLSNMKIILNNGVQDFDITSEMKIEGDPYEYILRWSPPMRVQSTYD